jgi:hydroxymethylpyrimidine/phosphomethylpyrimidine kinase
MLVDGGRLLTAPGLDASPIQDSRSSPTALVMASNPPDPSDPRPNPGAIRIPNVLSIAGSDPSGGAGILADIKAFSALGAYGTAVITALTAQNTLGVTGVELVPSGFVRAQLDTLLADVRIDAIKIGMLANAELAGVVAARLTGVACPIVVDPVMVAKSGDRLLDADAIDTLRRSVLPLATVLTPNLPEAGVLLGRAAPATFEAMRQAAADLQALGPRYVLVKGGHLRADESPDVLFDGRQFTELPAVRVPTHNTHGTGCTLSAAIAALLPQHPDVPTAVRVAKAYVSAALLASHELDVGSGHGPLHHFHALWPRASKH